MSLLLCVRKRLVLPAMLVAFPLFVEGQSVIVPQGNEYPIADALVGDQVYPNFSLNQNGGYLVWEGNGSVKSGTEIKAAHLNSSLLKISSFPVNKIVKGDQVRPQVQMLNNGNTIFVWQSYGLGNADIYARILKPDDLFATADIRVNSVIKGKGSPSSDQQSVPVVAALNDGGAMVVWQSLGQDGSMKGIYARKISASGPTTNTEFLVNQTTRYNQRDPAIATLTSGNIVIAWVSEFQRFGNPSGITSGNSIDAYARIFDEAGNPVSGELLLNSGNNLCANPSVAALPSGGFTVAWSEKDLLSRSNSWDVIGRSFSPDGIAVGGDFKINTFTYGDQFRPKIAAVGNDCVVVWTSLGQDGSREGVFGRLLAAGTQPTGDEFRANNTAVSQQIHPTIAATGASSFIVGWSSFVRTTGFDLFARKYSINQQP